MAGYLTWRFSIVENRYHIELEPNPVSVQRDQMYHICRDLMQKYWLHRMQRLVFEALLEAVWRRQRRKEDRVVERLLQDVNVNLERDHSA